MAAPTEEEADDAAVGRPATIMLRDIYDERIRLRPEVGD